MRAFVLAILVAAFGAGQPCCDIKSVDAKIGMVTAADKTIGRTFQFKVTDAAALKGLRAGRPIWANFETRKVSLGDVTSSCCTMVNLTAPAAGRGR